MKKWPVFLTMAVMLFFTVAAYAQHEIVLEKKNSRSFTIIPASGKDMIYVDTADFPLVRKAASMLAKDIEAVTGSRPEVVHHVPHAANSLIIIGSAGRSSLVRQLINNNKISRVKDQWEAYQIGSVIQPVKNIPHAVIITGNDRRGTAFGVFEFSKQLGVSPWSWWADVPVKKRKEIYISNSGFITDAPKVKYRGIFINDEAPALSGWSKEKFGGFNHLFYEKVFELMLRLKSNYIWPAMWGSAFYDDDSLNIKAADEYGIVIGTSHHEPLMRAHDEWRRYGNGKWDYENNESRLKDFWRAGMQRATNEKIVTVGMRGDGDEPMTRETATALLERIVKDQRSIIEEVTHQPASETPQLWALYKEVQDYYDKGMRVPDDITLLLCDDNWGNIRKLPKLNEKPRKGGYGIYYHFDYVGDPRNYKWLNTNPITRVWEQMHLAWEYKARDIWIVNVGDIKPMEFPISFFLDYAWNPESIGADDLQAYTERWSAEQFGKEHAKEIAEITSAYTKYNSRRKPELLNENTYSIYNYDEAKRVTDDYNNLSAKAEKISRQLPAAYQDAYFQLVLHPVKACANLQELYTTVALNHAAALRKQANANMLADKARQLYEKDSLITLQYHALGDGKWNHMMDQTHIGYTYWQQPLQQKMPDVRYVPTDSLLSPDIKIKRAPKTAINMIREAAGNNIFYEQDGYVSMEAAHYSKAVNTKEITWKKLPDHGRTGDAMTVFPVTAAKQKVASPNSPHLQYDLYVYDEGPVKLQCFFSPTLNFHNTDGLKYAVSIDNEPAQIVAINKESNDASIWGKWVADNIIIKTTAHTINKPGKHVIKYWMISPGVVLQKLVLDFGGVKQSYLGPPETKMK